MAKEIIHRDFVEHLAQSKIVKVEVESEIKKSFIAYSDLDEEMKADIEKRIHIANANIFEELHDLVNSSENVHQSYSAAAIV